MPSVPGGAVRRGLCRSLVVRHEFVGPAIRRRIDEFLRLGKAVEIDVGAGDVRVAEEVLEMATTC